jgi:acyl-CoA thioester hydrolase
MQVTYRGIVFPWHCDHMGHMNVMWFVGKFDEATWTLGAPYLREMKRGMAAVEQRIAYRREALPGDALTIRSASVELKPKVRSALLSRRARPALAPIRGLCSRVPRLQWHRGR